MSLKSQLLDKVEFVTGTVEVARETIAIRELSGAERSEMLKAETIEESSRIAYNAGVLDKSEHMDATEFAQAFRFNYRNVNKVVNEICRLSGYFDDDEETEKN